MPKEGVYQHRGEQHLQRYVAEFGFRHKYRVTYIRAYRTRARKALVGNVRRRLTYWGSTPR